MDPALVFLVITISAAAALQAATGIGFGVIAGPMLLALSGDASAIQISILLNLLIALLLAPALWRSVDSRVLPKLLLGIAIGSPLGYLIFVYLPIVHLKMLACLFVIFALLMLLLSERLSTALPSSRPKSAESVLMGTIAGVMGGSLAMPGPVPAAWMTIRGFSKDTVRASILVMFVFAYTAALVLQLFVTGIEQQTLIQGAWFALPTIAGILAGHWLADRLAEKTFRIILAVVLTTTSATLAISIFS